MVKNAKPYFKVVTADFKSLGLRKNPNILTFPPNRWIQDPDPKPDSGNDDYGGIWVAISQSQAKGVQRYMHNKYGLLTRLFQCEVGDIFYQNSYRAKTNKVRLTQEIVTDFSPKA